MTTTASDAKEIRKELKGIGLNSKDVSVRSQIYSMGSTIHMSIKSDKALKLKKEIEAIAANHEKIDRDEMTGEILCGGNHFIQVGVDWNFEHALMEKNESAIMTVINQAKEKMNQIMEYCGVKFFYDERRSEFCTAGHSGFGYREADHFKWVLMRNAY